MKIGIKQFGKLYLNKFSFKKCPINISEDRKYELRLGKENIIIKTGTNSRWLGIICENPLDHTIEKNIWKIKILKTYEYEIMVGIASSDFDINRASFDKTNNFGWYYSCYSGDLFSGPPHNYQNKKTNLTRNKSEVLVIMNMKKGSLKFIMDGEDKGNSFTDIPLNKPLFPSVLLCHKDDSVEITDNK